MPPLPDVSPDERLTESQAASLVLLERAVSANGDGRAALTDNLVAAVRALVEAFTGWYEEVAVRRLAKDIAGQVRPVQRVMAAQESAYLSQVTSLLKGSRVPPGSVLPAAQVDDLRVGISLDDAYARIAKQYRYERSIATPEADALSHVVTRADVMAQTDVALAARSQAQRFFEEHKITGYRRIVHPELSRGGSCGLCILASDRVYKRAKLMPIHARCHCGVMPIIGGWDAGNSLNNLDLSTLYTDAAGGSAKKPGTDARDLKRTRYAITDTGELGPTLVPHDSGRKRKQITTAGSQRFPEPA